MLFHSFANIGNYPSLLFLLCCLSSVAYSFLIPVISLLSGLLIVLIYHKIQRYRNYLQESKRSKEATQFYKKISNKLIHCGLKFVLLGLVFQSNIAFSQTDTLTEPQKDSIAYYYLPFMIAELKDYDLLKQKSAIQEKQIKGLQAISTNQKNLSVRQSIKIESYSTSLLKVQTDNYNLQTNLTKITKQRNLSRLENWLWRGGAIYFLGKIFKLY